MWLLQVRSPVFYDDGLADGQWYVNYLNTQLMPSLAFPFQRLGTFSPALQVPDALLTHVKIRKQTLNESS